MYCVMCIIYCAFLLELPRASRGPHATEHGDSEELEPEHLLIERRQLEPSHTPATASSTVSVVYTQLLKTYTQAFTQL